MTEHCIRVKKSGPDHPVDNDRQKLLANHQFEKSLQ